MPGAGAPTSSGQARRKQGGRKRPCAHTTIWWPNAQYALSAKHPYTYHVDVVASEGFALAFRLLCDNCLSRDSVKVSNMGWQGGTHDDALRRT